MNRKMKNNFSELEFQRFRLLLEFPENEQRNSDTKPVINCVFTEQCCLPSIVKVTLFDGNIFEEWWFKSIVIKLPSIRKYRITETSLNLLW